MRECKDKKVKEIAVKVKPIRIKIIYKSIKNDWYVRAMPSKQIFPAALIRGHSYTRVNRVIDKKET